MNSHTEEELKENKRTEILEALHEELLQVNSNALNACTRTAFSAHLIIWITLFFCFYGVILDSHQEIFEHVAVSHAVPAES
jgi:hypothetical protein